MLYLIGIGIDEKDISLKALEVGKKCSILYLDIYTSLGTDKKELEKLFEKRIFDADRDFLEDGIDILKQAKYKDVGILVYGDVFSATTHIGLVLEASKENIKTEVIHGISVFNYVTDIGLSFYNFGKTASISFNKSDVPFGILKNNLELGMHTLILLDLDPKNNKFLSIDDALTYLLDNGMGNILVIACSRLGCKDAFIKAGKARDILNIEFKEYSQCLIVPGKMHFIEEELIKKWK